MTGRWRPIDEWLNQAAVQETPPEPAWLAKARAATARAAAEPPPDFADLTHGTMFAYRKGCRCAACRQRQHERGVRHRAARNEREREAAS